MTTLDNILEKGMLLPEEFVFVDFDEMDEDTLPLDYVDGDNSLLENFMGGLPMTSEEIAAEDKRNLEAAFRLSLTTRRVVPFPRVLKLRAPYMVGKDVLALQRALARAGFRRWGNFTSAFGPGTKKNLQKFQATVDLPTTGVYELDTHKKLSKYYDSYGAFLMTQAMKNYTYSPRRIIMSYATHGYNQRHRIHYTQGPLRMYGVRNKVRPPRIPFYEDCSSFSTWCYWGSGLKDPNGLGYNGWGYTGTLCQNGTVTINPKPGDLAFYGVRPYSHVVVYIGNGRCISHGSEMGPYLLPVRYRSDFSHFRTYTK